MNSLKNIAEHNSNAFCSSVSVVYRGPEQNKLFSDFLFPFPVIVSLNYIFFFYRSRFCLEYRSLKGAMHSLYIELNADLMRIYFSIRQTFNCFCLYCLELSFSTEFTISVSRFSFVLFFEFFLSAVRLWSALLLFWFSFSFYLRFSE